MAQDFAELLKWYRLAADQNNAFAQNSLGLMYEKGEGVPQDIVRAHMWFNLSGAQGHGAGPEKSRPGRGLNDQGTDRGRAEARAKLEACGALEVDGFRLKSAGPAAAACKEAGDSHAGA